MKQTGLSVIGKFPKTGQGLHSAGLKPDINMTREQKKLKTKTLLPGYQSRASEADRKVEPDLGTLHT